MAKKSSQAPSKRARTSARGTAKPRRAKSSHARPKLTHIIAKICRSFPGVVGVAARNLTTGEEVTFNEDERFPTASMIKTMILYELFRQDASGRASMSERLPLRDQDRTTGSGMMCDLSTGTTLTLRDLALLMMALSDNTATNMLADRLGIDAINRAIAEAGMGSTRLHRKINFPNCEPDHETYGTGVTSPRDFRHFFTELRAGRLLPPERAEAMLKIMRIQKYIEPMRKKLPVSPYAEEFGEKMDTWVASKTGSLRGTRCESGLVHAPAAEWALCIMTTGSKDVSWTSENIGVRFISEISKAFYDAWGAKAKASAKAAAR
jgi:beta-lactamase class A